MFSASFSLLRWASSNSIMYISMNSSQDIVTSLSELALANRSSARLPGKYSPYWTNIW